MFQERIQGGGYGPSSPLSPQQLFQHSDQKAKVCRLANKWLALYPPLICSLKKYIYPITFFSVDMYTIARNIPGINGSVREKTYVKLNYLHIYINTFSM